MKNLSHIKRAFAATAIALITLGLWAPHAAKASTFGQSGRGSGGFAGNPQTSTYQIDDGTAENSVGLTAGGTFISLNEFTVTGGNNIINDIQIAWGTPNFPDPALNGLAYTAYLWSNPDGTGNPSGVNGAMLLASAPGVISAQGTNTFLISSFAPTTVSTANFFVGFVITHNAGQYPAAFDQDFMNLPNRSWITIGGDPNNLTGAGTIESFGLVGNWMIRADAVPEPSTYALFGLGLAAIVFLGRRQSRVAR